MDINLLISLIGTLLAVVSAAIAYLQLRYQILDIRRKPSAPRKRTAADVPLPSGFSLFAPKATIEGIATGLVDRKVQLGVLVKSLVRKKSLIVVEGVTGIGKTSLVAAFCQNPLLRMMGYGMGWVFCAQKSLTVRSLARSIALAHAFPKEHGFLVSAMTDTPSSQISDRLIEVLSKQRLVLVFDDYHLVSDEEVHKLVDNIAKSKLRSLVIVTSDIHLDSVEKLPTTQIIQLESLSLRDGVKFLRGQGVRGEEKTLHKIWKKSGNGVPEAMRILVGLSKTRSMFELLDDSFPAYTKDLEAWLGQLIGSLSASEIEVLRFVAFANEPVPIDLLRRTSPSDELLDQAVRSLINKFLLTRSRTYISLHALVQSHVFGLITQDEHTRYSVIVTDYFADKARDLLLGVKEEPSYGIAYLEAHPEYVQDESRHIRLIDSLVERLRDTGFSISHHPKALVLGAGHGTHDVALARHGLQIIDIELLHEVVAVGRKRAEDLRLPVTFLIADMTEELELEPNSMDFVFNLGSSFGYEVEDSKNARVFANAAKVLKPGRPFVFEYVNGGYWATNVERDIDVSELPDGSIRTKYKIYNPIRNTSLDVITLLQRPDGSSARFHHFMHYYDLAEVTTMMSQAGLEVTAVFGSAKGESFDPHKSRSMVVIATKAV